MAQWKYVKLPLKKICPEKKATRFVCQFKWSTGGKGTHWMALLECNVIQ